MNLSQTGQSHIIGHLAEIIKPISIVLHKGYSGLSTGGAISGFIGRSLILEESISEQLETTLQFNIGQVMLVNEIIKTDSRCRNLVILLATYRNVVVRYGMTVYRCC